VKDANPTDVALELGVGRTSVYRVLAETKD
jgi:hypothetical protein